MFESTYKLQMMCNDFINWKDEIRGVSLIKIKNISGNYNNSHDND